MRRNKAGKSTSGSTLIGHLPRGLREKEEATLLLETSLRRAEKRALNRQNVKASANWQNAKKKRTRGGEGERGTRESRDVSIIFLMSRNSISPLIVGKLEVDH